MDGDLVMTEQEKDQLAVCKEQGLPNDAELIDDVFYVWKTRFGLFSTMTKQGRKMLTGATREGVITMTHCILSVNKTHAWPIHSRGQFWRGWRKIVKVDSSRTGFAVLYHAELPRPAGTMYLRRVKETEFNRCN